MRVIKNIDDKVVFKNASDIAFIEFMRKIAIENEDFNFSILGVSDAEEYLEDYCDNLELTETE